MRAWSDSYFKFRHGVTRAAMSEKVQGNTPLLKLMSQLNVTEKEVRNEINTVLTSETGCSRNITHPLNPIPRRRGF